MGHDKTFPIETRVDIKHFAALARHFHKKGLSTKTRSAVIAQAVSLMHDALIGQGLFPVGTLEEAHTILSQLNLSPQRGQGGHRELAAALASSSIIDVTKEVLTDDADEFMRRLSENL